jgi:serine/arginine repetitive matrix protein 2
VRGTGTSGYVQTNKFNVRKRSGHKKHGNDGDGSGHTKKKVANKDIIEHNKKREIEVKVMEYRISLEDDDDVDEGAIEGLVAKFRQELMEKDTIDSEKKIRDTHEIAARKEKKMEVMKHALGFSDRDIVEGEAFDRDLQQRKKEERIAEKKRQEEERIQENKRIEKKRRKMHRAGYYEEDERPERYNHGDSESSYSQSETSSSQSDHSDED